MSVWYRNLRTCNWIVLLCFWQLRILWLKVIDILCLLRCCSGWKGCPRKNSFILAHFPWKQTNIWNNPLWTPFSIVPPLIIQEDGDSPGCTLAVSITAITQNIRAAKMALGEQIYHRINWCRCRQTVSFRADMFYEYPNINKVN